MTWPRQELGSKSMASCGLPDVDMLTRIGRCIPTSHVLRALLDEERSWNSSLGQNRNEQRLLRAVRELPIGNAPPLQWLRTCCRRPAPAMDHGVLPAV